jgi:hypothetical protein
VSRTRNPGSCGRRRAWLDCGAIRANGNRPASSPIYGWFSEGFDTLDLKEAKALLEKLHA